MINDDMTFEAHEQIVKPFSQTCDHIWRATVAQREKCACVRTAKVLSVFPPSRSWQLPLSGRETVRKNKKSEKCARLHMESGFK